MASSAELVAELARIGAENARLRSLLGLDDRSADGHATAWSPMLLPAVVSGAPVDSSSSKSEKLVLLSSLFGARSDVYERYAGLGFTDLVFHHPRPADDPVWTEPEEIVEQLAADVLPKLR